MHKRDILRCNYKLGYTVYECNVYMCISISIYGYNVHLAEDFTNELS